MDGVDRWIKLLWLVLAVGLDSLCWLLLTVSYCFCWQLVDSLLMVVACVDKFVNGGSFC